MEDRSLDGAAAAPLPESAREALRRSAEDALPRQPARDSGDVEVWIRQTEIAIWTYREPEAARAALAEADVVAPETPNDLDALARAARTLSQRISALGDDARRRLEASDAIDSAGIDRLRLLAEVTAAACGAALRDAHDGPAADAPVGQDAEVMLVEQLAGVWHAHTGEPIPEDRTGGSAFARYVEAACIIAGVDRQHAERVRIRVSQTANLLESAEMLATIPDFGED